MYSVAKITVLGGALLLLAACSTSGQREGHEPAVVETPAPTWSKDGEGQPAKAARPAPRSALDKQVAVVSPEEAPQATDLHKRALLAETEAPLQGSEIGYYADILEARMIQLNRETEVSFVRTGNRITISLAGTETFASNRSRILAPARQKLEVLAAVLEEYQKTLIAIHGHTDDAGEEDYNQSLSERRALAVARLFIEAGVGKERIVVVGYGENRPVASNDTEQGRAANRRIELILEPLSE
jgi:outer membrane protein OmpA-like peptidoglycan-associated protein